MSSALTLGQWIARHDDLSLLERHAVAGFCLERPRSALIAHPEQALSPDQQTHLEQAAARLRNGEPLAYITGEREFWSLPFAVDPRVLVPRPDTELLIETALRLLGALTGPLQVVDLGTGSGAIIVALGHELRTRPQLELFATDACPDALMLAAENAARHGVTVTFRHQHWLREDQERYDLIVSNPPYIAAADPHLANLQHEPSSALIAGEDGLRDLREIARSAGANLKPGGYLLLEHGYDQSDAVADLLRNNGLQDVQTAADLAGHPRVTYARQGDSRDAG